MSNHAISTQLYIGLGRRKILLQSWSTTLAVTDVEIDTYGSIWGERQVLNLGSHFNLYSNYDPNQWQIGNQMGLFGLNVLPSTAQIASLKLPGGSISGNFGEVLTVLALQAKVPPRRNRSLRVGHLCPTPGNTSVKCPDLLVETAPLEQEYNEYSSRFENTLPRLPQFLPGECKNSDTLGALRQIITYWQSSGANNACFGFGLISSIHYRSPSSITFNLLVPRNVENLNNLLSQPGFDVQTIKQAHMQGILYGI